jgi:hypothetical protein
MSRNVLHLPTWRKEVRHFLETLADQWQFRNYEEWYKVSGSEITNNGGSEIVMHYRGSIYTMLEEIFPEYKWLPWRFASVPKQASLS